MGSFNTKPSAYGLHLTESIGAKCGSTTIDRNLFTLLERKYGSGLKDKTDQISAGSRFMKSFESIKRTFDGKKETKFNIFIAMNHQDRKGYEKALRAVVLTRFDQHAETGCYFDVWMKLLICVRQKQARS